MRESTRDACSKQNKDMNQLEASPKSLAVHLFVVKFRTTAWFGTAGDLGAISS